MTCRLCLHKMRWQLCHKFVGLVGNPVILFAAMGDNPYVRRTLLPRRRASASKIKSFLLVWLQQFGKILIVFVTY